MRAGDVVDLMIDRGLRDLEKAQNDQVRFHTTIGLLRFTNLKRPRFLEVQDKVEVAFAHDSPDSIRTWFRSIEEAM